MSTKTLPPEAFENWKRLRDSVAKAQSLVHQMMVHPNITHGDPLLVEAVWMYRRTFAALREVSESMVKHRPHSYSASFRQRMQHTAVEDFLRNARKGVF